MILKQLANRVRVRPGFDIIAQSAMGFELISLADMMTHITPTERHNATAHDKS